MIIINYTKSGIAHSDFEVEEILKSILKENKDITINTSTTNIIEMVRVLVAEEIIKEDNIIIQFEGDLEIKCSKIGQLRSNKEIPNEFDFFENCLDRILKL
jgi:hypothetical protein